MRVSSQNTLSVTYALLHSATRLSAVAALHGNTDRAALEGLVEVLYREHSSREGFAVLEALQAFDDPLALDALAHTLDSPHAPVRLAAVEQLHRRGASDVDERLARLIRTDPSTLVRRAAVRALGARPEPMRREILAAADDPHWRVRHALIQVLLNRGEEESRTIDERLSARGDLRSEGVRLYLRFRRCGEIPSEYLEPVTWPCHSAGFWDWDVAVLARKLAALGCTGRQQHIDMMPSLLAHPDERVRSLAADALRRADSASHFAATIALLDDPRLGSVEPVTKLLEALDDDMREEIANVIIDMATPSPAQLTWARRSEPRPSGSGGEAPLPDGRGSDADSHPLIRAAALTPDRAADLVRNPESETSWLVLGKAARMAKVPLWDLAPAEPWTPPESPMIVPPPLVLPAVEPANVRLLGPEKWCVSAMGASGHYGLPAEGFVRAVERGVNLFFWEPNYAGLTDFMTRIGPAERQRVHVIAGTFEAEGERVRKDVERALRMLRLERIPLFLLFWVQTWDRISDEVRDELDRLIHAGKIGCFSLSTHNRALAVEAMNAGWDPIMVRHSAAHRGAESHVLPHAVERGTSIITFNNTCYGRLLKPHGSHPVPSVADCYRYTLAQPGVTMCLSAPATIEQLEENLTALHDPALPEDRRAVLLAQGERVYREDTVFRKLVRAL